MLTVLINAVSAKSGGAATYVKNLAREVAAVDGRNRYVFHVPRAVADCMAAAGGGVQVAPTQVGYGPVWRRVLWDQVVLRRLARTVQADVLLSSSDFGMLRPVCKQVTMVRNPLPFSDLYKTYLLPRKSRRFRCEFAARRWLTCLSARSSDLVVTASQSMMEDLRRTLRVPEEKLRVNPFGVPLERFPPVHRQPGAGAELRLLYVSEYSDYKNLTTLLQAIICLLTAGAKRLRLVTTADPGQFPREEILSRQTDRGLAAHPILNGHVVFCGSVAYEEIRSLYADSDVFVFPSLAESFGHPLVEAMASGLPIIASDIPIHREMCAEAALYFSPLDPKDLADKIMALHSSPVLRAQLAQAGRRRAEAEYDWKDHVTRLIHLCEEVAVTTDA